MKSILCPPDPVRITTFLVDPLVPSEMELFSTNRLIRESLRSRDSSVDWVTSVAGKLQIRISIILFIVISVRMTTVSKQNTVTQTNLGVIYFTVYRIAFIHEVARGKKEVLAGSLWAIGPRGVYGMTKEE